MKYDVVFHQFFVREYMALPPAVRVELGAQSRALSEMGDFVRHPRRRTLSAYTNLHELRLVVKDASWRVAFALGPARLIVLLCGSSEGDVGPGTLRDRLTATAEGRLAKVRRDWSEGNESLDFTLGQLPADERALLDERCRELTEARNFEELKVLAVKIQTDLEGCSKGEGTGLRLPNYADVRLLDLRKQMDALGGKLEISVVVAGNRIEVLNAK